MTPEGGESVLDVKTRVLKARDEVLAVVPNGAASCVVSHLWVTRSMISEALGIEVRGSARSEATILPYTLHRCCC